MSDYENKLMALAAENALLKNSVREWAKAVDNADFEHHGEIFTGSIESAEEELATLTPETNKVLDEVRQEGVRQYAEYLKEKGLYDQAKQVLSYLVKK